MFVYRREDLPSDPIFPPNYEKLGYFITHNDQIRKISNPDEEFQFKINKNPRWNEIQREAMNECIRNTVHARLHDLGLRPLHLPVDAGASSPRIPILVSSNLSTAKRVVVVFGEPIQDLGIWAYRSVGTEDINTGSAVNLVKALLSSSSEDKDMDKDSPRTGKDETGIILANTGQLLWHHKAQKPVTHATWMALPRPSAVDPPLTISSRNKVPRNTNWQEHIECVFEDVLDPEKGVVCHDAKVQIIGVAEGGLGVVRFLGENWSAWKSTISAICLTNPLHFTHIHLPDSSANNPDSFAAFLSSRCRAYVLSNEPLNIPVPDGERQHGCNCYSSGEGLNIECILPAAWRAVVKWLEKTYEDPGFCEARLVVRDVDVEELERLEIGDAGEETED